MNRREEPPPDWEQGEGEIVGDYKVFRVRRQPTRSPRTGRDMDYHVIEVPDWVHVVPVTEDGRLVLVEQFRHGIGDVGLEFPAGILEPDEPPVDAGLRELEEETGYIAADARVLARLSPNPALQNNRVTIVVATGCRPIGRRDQDEGEDLRVRLVMPADVPRLIDARRIRDVHSVASWYLYEHGTATTPPPTPR